MKKQSTSPIEVKEFNYKCLKCGSTYTKLQKPLNYLNCIVQKPITRENCNGQLIKI